MTSVKIKNYSVNYVYILECADKTLYVGCTKDLGKRIKQHNGSKKGAHYTKIRRPVSLKYFEVHETLSSALKRECEIKKLARQKKICLIKNGKRPARRRRPRMKFD